MLQDLVVAFFAACLALLFREYATRRERAEHAKKIAGLCLRHLEQIGEDLRNHVEIEGDRVYFRELQLREVEVGDFLYDLITANIHFFASALELEKTITFFHHYKINMATVRDRLDASRSKGYLKQDSYDALLVYLDGSVAELKELAGT